jgi:hypothetical protein
VKDERESGFKKINCVIYIYYSYSDPQKKERHAMLVDVLCLLVSFAFGLCCRVPFSFSFTQVHIEQTSVVKEGKQDTNECLFFFFGGGCGGACLSPRPPSLLLSLCDLSFWTFITTWIHIMRDDGLKA